MALCIQLEVSEGEERRLMFQDTLKEYGKKNGWCPYFIARHGVSILYIVAARLSLDSIRSKQEVAR